MTMAMSAVKRGQGGRVLRLGLVQDGRIAYEKIIRDRRPVVVGPTEKCDIVLPVSRATLFSPAPGGRITLHLTKGMKGRVSTADGVRDLEAALANGVREISLDDQARGKIVLGDAAVLLQMVHAPPVMPRPQLPAAVQGGFWRSIDWRFTGFVTASFLGFLSFLVFLESADFPVDQTVAMIPADYAQLLMEEPEPPPEPDVPEVVDGDPADSEPDQVADATDVPSDARPDSPSRPHNRTDAPPSIVDRDQIRTAALLELGSLMRSDDGPTAVDHLLAGADTSDAASVLAMVDATTSSANADPNALHERGSSTGEPTSDGIASLHVAGTDRTNREIATGPVIERVVTAWVDPQRPVDEGGAGVFESRVVAARVRGYMAGIRRCYETQLRHDPTLAGKVTTKFTILESGSVTHVTAIENTTGSPALAQCVGGILGRMRFRTGPEGGSVDFSYPFVFAPQR